jgi:hypothetical protein
MKNTTANRVVHPDRDLADRESLTPQYIWIFPMKNRDRLHIEVHQDIWQPCS